MNLYHFLCVLRVSVVFSVKPTFDCKNMTFAVLRLTYWLIANAYLRQNVVLYRHTLTVTPNIC